MGKHKLIETPEKLWDIFKEYKEYIITNPRTIEKALQSGKIATEKLRVPLTMEGFELFVFEKGLNSELSHYFSNKDNRYSDYVAICQRIKKAIRNDQIEGGMVGQYNPSITQRLNNLTEKTDITTDGKGINEIKVNIIKPSDTNTNEL
jgi:hypothetical protein